MSTLTINDLARTEQLHRGVMRAVRGGFNAGTKHGGWGYPLGDVTFAPRSDSSIDAVQNLMQQQSVTTATANGAAFIDGVHVNSRVSQDGQNKIIG